MRKGFLYPAAIMDWHNRKVLAWRISKTLKTDFSVEPLSKTIARLCPSVIMSTNQGSKFTSLDWTDRLRDPACVSRWMAKTGSSTISLSSVSGGR